MSYVSIDQTKLVSGEPVTQDMLVEVAQDLDDLNTRLIADEAAVQNFEPLTFEVDGNYYGEGNGQVGVTYKRVFANITLLGILVLIIEDGLSGASDLQIDIQYKRGASPFASIFSTLPDIAQGGGDLNVSIGGGVLGVTSLLVGDILRLDIPQVMEGNNGFQALLAFQIT